jgi:molybdopterin molybdotransferase
MLDKRIPILIKQAHEKIMEQDIVGKTEIIPIHECDQRYLGEDIIATNDVPLFTRSGFDGFALRSKDTENSSSDQPIKLRIVEELGAGMVPNKEIGPFETTRIMTGTMVPNGCDAIIMLEAVKEIEENGGKYIVIKQKVNRGNHISYQGEEAKKGDVIIKKGAKITPGVMALLATFGYAKVRVAVKPKIGIFVTGNELLDVDEPLQNGKIRESNSFMIASQVRRAGGEPIFLGKLPDVLDICTNEVKAELNDVDMLITTGGVSVGDYDLMPDVYKALNGNVLFNKVAMRPGSVTTVAILGRKFLFGLSGNPSASYVGFELFTRPVIRKMLFCENVYLKSVVAQLTDDFTRANPITRFIRSKLYFKNEQFFVEPAGMDKSNVVMSLAHTDSFAVLPGRQSGFKKGEQVQVLLLGVDS